MEVNFPDVPVVVEPFAVSAGVVAVAVAHSSSAVVAEASASVVASGLVASASG